MWGSFGFVCFFFSSSWNVPGNNIFLVRLLCDWECTPWLWSLIAAALKCWLVILRSYWPCGRNSGSLRNAISAKDWKNFWCSLVYFLLPSFSKRGYMRFDRSSSWFFIHGSLLFPDIQVQGSIIALMRVLTGAGTVECSPCCWELWKSCDGGVVLDKVYSLSMGWHCRVVWSPSWEEAWVLY